MYISLLYVVVCIPTFIIIIMYFNKFIEHNNNNCKKMEA